MSNDQEMQLRWIRGRDADAFAELVIRYAGMVYATCRRVLGNPNDAEDVAQECFVELARSSRVVKPSLGGWLHRVAVYRSLNRLRADARRAAREKQYVDTHAGAATENWDDIKPHLDAAMAELPEKLRLALVHRFLEGQTQDDVAKTLGISRSTAQYRITRGVDEVRKALRRRGVIVSAAVFIELAASRTAEAAPASLVARLGERAIAAYPKAATGSGLATMLSWRVATGVLIVVAAGGALWFTMTKTDGRATATPTDTTQASGVDVVEDEPPSATNSTASETPAPLVAASEGVTVTGRVYAKGNGEPFPFFHVEAYVGGDSSEPVAKSNADAHGNYRLEGLHPGEYTIQSYDNRFSYHEQVKGEARSGAPLRTGRISLHVNQDDRALDADIPLDVDLCLLGTVVKSDGTPVPEATVWARGENDVHQYWSERVTNADGRFMFIGLEPNTEVYVQASADGLVSQPAGPFTVAGHDATNAKVVVEPAASMQGTVLSPEGKAVPSGKIWIQPNQARVVHPRFAICDEAGRFDVVGLAAGAYDLFLAPVTSHPTDEETDTSHFFWDTIRGVYPDPEPALQVTLRRGEARTGLRVSFPSRGISGRVTDTDGRPIAGAHISLMGGADANTNDDGRYALVGMPAGAHSVYVSHEDYRSDRLDDIPAGAESADFALDKRGVVEGQVVDAKTGRPIAEFGLYTSPDRPYEAWMDAWFKAHTDAEGRFTYKPNFPSERIFARAQGYRVGSVGVADVDPEGPPTQVRIALEPSAPVPGIVTDTDGKPVKGAAIYNGALPNSARERETAALATTDANGHFSLDSLPPGPLTLVAYHEIEGFGETLMEDGAVENVSVTLSPFGEMSGQVTAQGQPVADETVPIMIFREMPALESMPLRPRAVVHRKTEADGTFLARQLPPGFAQLSCKNGERRRFVNAEIAPGETTEVDIDFPAVTATVTGRVVNLDRLPTPPEAVSLDLRNAAGNETFITPIKPDGTYAFDAVIAGEGNLYLFIPNAQGLRVPDPITVEDGASLVREIDAEACQSITE